MATWAFANGNRFDLVALPRLAGVALDASYLDATALESDPEPSAEPRSRRGIAIGAGMAALLLLGALGLDLPAPRTAGRDGRGRTRPRPIPRPLATTAPPPTIADDVAEGLADLADRCGIAANDLEGDPTALMARLSDRLRYRGPLLSPGDLARIEDESERRRLAGLGRPHPPLPARSPLARRLPPSLPAKAARHARLVVPPPPLRGTIAEAPDALADELAVEGTTRTSTDPTLAAYARFLGLLPRR